MILKISCLGRFQSNIKICVYINSETMLSSNMRHAKREWSTDSINRLEAKKRGMEANYLQSADILEKEVNEIERRIGIAKSKVKKDILLKQRKHLEEVSDRLDEEFENDIKKCDRIINKHSSSLKELEEKINIEGSSLDFNIDCLRKYKDNLGTYNMSQVLENIINALEIIKGEKSTSS